MYINKLTLTNFRNYENQDIELNKGINLFIGNNAQGKTNIIESIYIASFGKSYRTLKESELVKLEKDYTRITVEYEKNNTNNKIEVYVDGTGKKILKKNSVKISKISDHVGELLLVIFSPESLDIVKGSPEKRRKFIDMVCCQLSKSYILNHSEYTKCLKLKNSMLKKEEVDREYIKVLNKKMSKNIEYISKFRRQIIKKILSKSKTIHSNITNNKETIEIKYISDFIDLTQEEIENLLNKYIEIEIIRRSSLKGIQRDDIEIYINALDVSKYGSQGQKRTVLLTLKLSDFEVLIEEKNQIPLLLLDDIMSELDKSRIEFLLNYIKDYQSIVTTTEFENEKNIENINILRVSNGTLEIL